jgi:hypothetical protein
MDRGAREDMGIRAGETGSRRLRVKNAGCNEDVVVEPAKL